MILRFSVRNFRSIGDEQEISFIASKLNDRDVNLISVANQKYKVLPSAVIYGANASGKSNLLKAMEFFQKGILNSHQIDDEEPQNLPVFLLDGVDETDAITMEMDFIMNYIDEDEDEDESRIDEPIRMTYGFTLGRKGIQEEWLFSFPKQYRKVLFHRNTSEDSVYYFGPGLKGHNKIISDNTKAFALFLSTAYANNHHQLSKIRRFFRRGMFFNLDNDADKNEKFSTAFLEQEGIRQRILTFIQGADVGICDAKIEIEKRPQDISLMASQLKELFTKYAPKRQIPSSVDEDERKKIKLGHKTINRVVYLDLNEESRGTVSFLNLIGWAIIALETGASLVVDELDSSLHPLLCRRIVEMFNGESNKTGAQLIFSTHDTTLLSNDLVRRDQVWFSEKDERGSSHYYPLTDLKVRKTDNFEQGYLDGRFGAIPYVGSFSKLI